MKPPPPSSTKKPSSGAMSTTKLPSRLPAAPGSANGGVRSSSQSKENQKLAATAGNGEGSEG